MYGVPDWASRTVSGYIKGAVAGELENTPIPAIIERCTRGLGRTLFGDELQRMRFVECLKLNTSNRKAWSAEFLIRRYQLGISTSTFKRYRAEFVREVARELGMLSD